MTEVVLYTRVNCHLCDECKSALERVRALEPFDLTIIDVDSDPALVEKYGQEVPVVLIDGRKAAKFRIDETAFLRRLRMT